MMSMTIGMIKYHLLMLWREPLNMFFGLCLPFIFLFAFAGMADEATIPRLIEGNFTAWLLVAAMVLALMDSAFSHAYTRQIKFLRLLRMTPVKPWLYFVTGIITRLGVLFVTAAALLTAMVVMFDKDIFNTSGYQWVPQYAYVDGVYQRVGSELMYVGSVARNWPMFILLLILAFVMFYFLGMFLANFLKNPKMSQNLLYVVFFGLLLFGMWIPTEAFPQIIQDIIPYLPHFSGVIVTQAAWLGEGILEGSNALWAVLGTTVAFGVLSLVVFKFE